MTVTDINQYQDKNDSGLPYAKVGDEMFTEQQWSWYWHKEFRKHVRQLQTSEVQAVIGFWHPEELDKALCKASSYSGKRKSYSPTEAELKRLWWYRLPESETPELSTDYKPNDRPFKDNFVFCEEARPYGYRTSYQRGPRTAHRVGETVPEFLKILIVFTPAVALVVVTVLMLLGQVQL